MSKLKNPPVPFLDLSAQFAGLRDEWLHSIAEIGSRGSFILGPNVSSFEQEFAEFTGTGAAVALANGTDALVLSLKALGIGNGDEVITTPYTFFATAEAINHVGATPVFADIRLDDFNIDPDKVRAAITDRTRAIIPVHLFGCPADMNALLELARDHHLQIIEDCAQACGATSNGKRVGSLGTMGTFSFYPTKILACYGDGGMVTTDDPVLIERLRKLRNHGAIGSFIHDEVAYNSRLDEVQAALLRLKLTAVEASIAARRRVAAMYEDFFAGADVTTPGGAGHVYNLYTIRSRHRDRIRRHLEEARIGFSVCYPQPLHLQPVYQYLGYKPGDLPQSETAATESISLPVFPEMLPEQVEIVSEVLKAAL